MIPVMFRHTVARGISYTAVLQRDAEVVTPPVLGKDYMPYTHSVERWIA